VSLLIFLSAKWILCPSLSLSLSLSLCLCLSVCVHCICESVDLRLDVNYSMFAVCARVKCVNHVHNKYVNIRHGACYRSSVTSNALKRVKGCVQLFAGSPFQSVTCHTRSHSVTCHPTQVNAPLLNPSHAGQYSIYLPRRDGRLSWPWWLVIYWDGLPVRRQSPIQVTTW